MIRAAKLERSPRLQAFLRFLEDRGDRGATTFEIAQETRSCAVHTDCSELRANGFVIDVRQVGHENGRRIYLYRLKGKPAASAA